MVTYRAIERANAEDIAERLKAALAVNDVKAAERERNALRTLLDALPNGSLLIDKYSQLAGEES